MLASTSMINNLFFCCKSLVLLRNKTTKLPYNLILAMPVLPSQHFYHKYSHPFSYLNFHHLWKIKSINTSQSQQESTQFCITVLVDAIIQNLYYSSIFVLKNGVLKRTPLLMFDSKSTQQSIRSSSMDLDKQIKLSHNFKA